MSRFMMSAALVFGLSQPLAAQETADAPTGPNWLVSCSNQQDAVQLICSMSQNVVVTTSNTRLLRVVFQPVDDQTHAMSFILPFGLDLTADITVNVDDTPWQSIPVNTCDAEACYAQTTIANDDLGPLRSGRELNVVLQNVQGQSINMALNLVGFTQSLDMMAR